ncbi:hypothetical protein CYY_006886 [Polysphondylium violaceum]|uniref:Peptidase S53 domain-containing protein n=1 Tax=Polysphondylium violaceum TaxID=133409 RepID=A0A8J4PPK2_9MYCE|nr:hypothetical protein CYY_006886 [Polysphondylium violaceum]
MSKTLLLVFLGIVALAASFRHENVMIASVDSVPHHFMTIKPAVSSDSVHFKILLHQQNLDKLEALFWEVSNPKSSLYKNFLNKQQVDSLVAPSQDAVMEVAHWLIKHNIKKSEIDVNTDYIAVSTNVEKASKLFGSEFAVYQSRITKNTRVRLNGPAFVPFVVSQHIDFIVGLSDFIEDNKMVQSMRTQERMMGTASATITPAFIRKFYGVGNAIGTNGANFQSIAAFTDYFSTPALEYFDKQFNIDPATVKVIKQGQDCISQGCDSMESNLDVQYITSIGNNITTLFLSEPNGAWTLDWALDIQKQHPMPLVSSISYGWAEIEQCEITSDCSTLGVSSAQYVARTNVEFQKIGIQGSSILVSSGDDGAPSFGGASGNCPIDNSIYCPIGGCSYKSTQCSEVTITSSNGTKCFFPMGLQSNACQEVLGSDEGNAVINAYFQSQSGSCAVHLDQDSEQNYHLSTTCKCSQLKTFKKSGYTIVGYEFDESAGTVFQPDYPTSSPYVTSVGATQILTNNQEIVCSVSTGAIITGGGGFAITQAQPAYQADAVNAYLNSGAQGLPSSQYYNASNRAYPDITLVGHAYQIGYTKGQNTEQCPCAITSVDGTSCSSPTLAGLISLINDKLLNAGHKQLGFLNPLLYQAAAAQPNVFNDITSGNNNCNRAYCCEYGFPATKGYDAASGLGSLNFANFESYVFNN